MLSAHARTLKAVIWHQKQKLVQCSTCKQRFGQFGFFSARQRPKNGLTRFERHFLAKCPGVNGLIFKVIKYHFIIILNSSIEILKVMIVVLLGDLGISRILMGTSDMATTFTGTPYYMSPEVLKHEGYKYKSDIWYKS